MEIRNAVRSGLGCGAPVEPERLHATREALLPMWRALPLNSFGRMDRSFLRHIGHRHFMRRFGISVRGFEPALAVNHSHAGIADILSLKAARYVETALRTHLVAAHGYSIDDAVYMIIMLEQLIFDSDSSLVEHVYTEQNKSTQEPLTFVEAKAVLESYFIHWLVGDDIHTNRNALANLHNSTYLKTASLSDFKEWVFLRDFVRGQITTFEWARRQRGAERGRSKDAWSMQYSFDDVHEVVASLTKSFASFWDSECRATKEALTQMDVHGIGRVPLAKFYEAISNQQHRFAETDTYLRELGALDETSSALGTQVLIANYVQSAANCIVSTAHYRVCCLNECETLFSEIESAFAFPEAEPSSVLAIVNNLKLQAECDDDEQPFVESGLASQLDQIALGNGGVVRLHGRLFAQWLHYAFPRECAFPHKMGKVKHMTPREYGGESIASLEVIQNQFVDLLDSFEFANSSNFTKDDLEWMSQWSVDEELVTDTIPDIEWSLPTPRSRVNLTLASGSLVLLAGVLGSIFRKSWKGIDAQELHSHLV